MNKGDPRRRNFSAVRTNMTDGPLIPPPRLDGWTRGYFIMGDCFDQILGSRNADIQADQIGERSKAGAKNSADTSAIGGGQLCRIEIDFGATCRKVAPKKCKYSVNP